MVLEIVGGTFGAVCVVLIGINLYYRHETIKSLERDLSNVSWRNAPAFEYIMRSYHYVADRFPKENRTWLKRPWRNLFYRNLWTRRKGMPCHIQTILFNRVVLARFGKKFAKNLKIVMTKSFSKGMYIHFYPKIKWKGKWIDADVWGKKWGIPFGKNIHNSEIKE